jgi:hypothetical protein
MKLAKVAQAINRALFKKVDSTGLAIFRICFSSVLTLQILVFYRFKHMMFDRIPFVYVGEIEPDLFLASWLIATICLIFGLFTKPASIVNYVMGVMVFSSSKQWEVHVFYSYVGISFLMMFLPMGKRFSLDNLIRRFKYSNNTLYEPNYLVSAIHYSAPILFGIGFMYFDSVLFKLQTYMWMNGIGMWMPATIPAATWNDTSFILNQKELVIFLNYFVIVFELLFVVLMWFKHFRLPIFIIGTIFHIGIGITYPIPLFAAAYASMYLLLVPLSVWASLGKLFDKFWTFNTPEFLPGDAKSMNRAIVYDHFLGPRRFSNNNADQVYALPSLPGEYLFRLQWLIIFYVFFGLQFIISWFSPFSSFMRAKTQYKIEHFVTSKLIEPLYLNLQKFSHNYFGITHHGVFVDHHFRGFNHIFRAEFVDKFGRRHHVPILDKNGLVDKLVLEQTWCNIAFRTITQVVRQNIFEPNFKLFLFQYIYEYKPNGAANDGEGTFYLYGKKIKVAWKWEHDMLKKNMDAPWLPVGTCHFDGPDVIYNWNQNMADILESEKEDPYGTKL